MKAFSEYNKWLLLLFVSLVWGSSFFVRNGALKAYSELQTATLQIFVTFLFFIPFIIRFFKKLSRKNVWLVAISALVGNACTSLFFALGQHKISSSLTGILSALVPILTLILSILFFKYKTRWRAWLGIIIGFIGTGIIIWEGQNYGETYFWGVVFVFIAVLCASMNINIIGFLLKNLSGTEIAALSFLIIGPPAGFIAFFTDFQPVVNTQSFWYASKMLVLLGLITFVGAISYNVLIKISSHVFASFAAYIIPIVAVLIGVFAGNESLTYLHFLAMLLIFLGIFWTGRS